MLHLPSHFLLCCKPVTELFSSWKQEINVLDEVTSRLTADVEAGPGQNQSSWLSVTHQVVSRLLLGAAQVPQGDAEGAVTQHRRAAAGHTLPVQRPVQRAGGHAHLGAQGAPGRHSGADEENRILGRHQGHVWTGQVRHTQTLQEVHLVFIFLYLVTSPTCFYVSALNFHLLNLPLLHRVSSSS